MQSRLCKAVRDRQAHYTASSFLMISPHKAALVSLFIGCCIKTLAAAKPSTTLPLSYACLCETRRESLSVQLSTLNASYFHKFLAKQGLFLRRVIAQLLNFVALRVHCSLCHIRPLFMRQFSFPIHIGSLSHSPWHSHSHSLSSIVGSCTATQVVILWPNLLRNRQLMRAIPRQFPPKSRRSC